MTPLELLIKARQESAALSLTPVVGTIKTIEQEPESLLKLCINCFHLASSKNGSDNFRCFAPQNFDRINLVDGAKLYKTEFCSELRHGTKVDICSENGDWFVQAPPKKQSVWIEVSDPSKTVSLALSKQPTKSRKLSMSLDDL